MKRILLSFLGGILMLSVSQAQTKPLPAFSPTRSEMLQRYKVATERDSLVRRTAFRLSVTPNWSGGSAFWYRNILADSVAQYYLVDPETNMKRPLFDAEKLAAALVEAGHTKATATKLPIRNAYLHPDQKKLAIAVGNKFYELDLIQYQLTKIDSLPVDKTVYPGLTRAASRWQRGRMVRTSPDQQWNIVVKEHNIYLEPAKGGTAIPYTTDGTADTPYGEVSWSPDSKYLIAYKIKRVVDKPVFYVLTSMPK